jgi:hypothetical protein
LIKNAILIVSAMDDWADADVWRLAAEQAYITAVREAKSVYDDHTLKAFAGLREELDQLNMLKARDFEALIALGKEDEERYEEDEDDYEDDYEDGNKDEDKNKDEDENEDEGEGEDEGEDEDEGANASLEAETIDLPIRPASEHDHKTRTSFSC